MLWGWSFDALAWMVKIALWVAFATGAVAALSAFIAGYVGYELADAAQKATELRVAEARLRSEEAKARAAVADQKAAEAQLALEKFKAPRILDQDQQVRIADKLKPFGPLPFDFSIQNEPEAINLMEQIADTLYLAGWVRQGVSASIVFTNPGKPPAGLVAFTGLEIDIDDSQTQAWGVPVSTLVEMLKQEGITATGRRLTDKSDTATAIHIKIGKKP